MGSEVLALELLVLLLEEPTDDSVEVAVGFTKECGALLQEVSPTGLHGGLNRGFQRGSEWGFSWELGYG